MWEVQNRVIHSANMQCSPEQFSTVRVTDWPNLTFCHIYQTALETFQVCFFLKCDSQEGRLSLKYSDTVFVQLYWHKPVGADETWKISLEVLKNYGKFYKQG